MVEVEYYPYLDLYIIVGTKGEEKFTREFIQDTNMDKHTLRKIAQNLGEDPDAVEHAYKQLKNLVDKREQQHNALKNAAQGQRTTAPKTAAQHQNMYKQMFGKPFLTQHPMYKYVNWFMDEAEPKKRKEIPRRKTTKPVTAFRAWHLGMDHNDRWLLRSVARPDVWETPNIRADREPDVPAHSEREYITWAQFGNQSGTYGIHAVRDVSDVMRQYPNALVFGVVTLHGTVVVHRLGYRASRATVRHLVVIDQGWVTTGASFGLMYAPSPLPFLFAYDREQTARSRFIAEAVESLERTFQCEVTSAPRANVTQELEKWTSEK